MITKYDQFVNEKININDNYLLLESLNIENDDKLYFVEIFNSIYEFHLTDFEKTLLNEFDYSLNESWFDDLKDKATKGVLKIKSQAGELLTSVAKKAKDIVDFVKLIATQIRDAVSGLIKNSVSTFKSKIIPKPELLVLITDYMNRKGDNLKKWVDGAGTILKFVLTELPVKLFNKLINFFKNVFSKGTNEGFNYFCNDFLNEGDETEKKSFLQRLGDKIQSLPPFSWIPKMEDMIKQGLYAVEEFIRKFFIWIDKEDEEKVTEAVDLLKETDRFVRGLRFLFDMLEIYVIYKFNEKIGNKLKEFQEAMKKGDISTFTHDIKNKTLDEIYGKIGIDPKSVVDKIKGIAQKIPYISDILAILENLALCIGIYQTIQPTLAKINPSSPKSTEQPKEVQKSQPIKETQPNKEVQKTQPEKVVQTEQK